MKAIIGVYHKLLIDISHELSILKYPHTIIGKNLKDKKVINNARKYICPIYLVDGIKQLSKVPLGCFSIIVDCKVRLERSNCDIIDIKTNFKKALRHYLSLYRNDTERKTLLEKNITLKEVADVATSYSFLNDVQSHIYKITPYDFRKKVQHAIISYFYGSMTIASLKDLLSQHNKLAEIRKKCFSQEANKFKKAIRMYKDCKDENKVSAETGFATFDILYIIKSYEKEMEIMEKIRQGIPIPKAGRKRKHPVKPIKIAKLKGY